MVFNHDFGRMSFMKNPLCLVRLLINRWKFKISNLTCLSTEINLLPAKYHCFQCMFALVVDFFSRMYQKSLLEFKIKYLLRPLFVYDNGRVSIFLAFLASSRIWAFIPGFNKTQNELIFCEYSLNLPRYTTLPFYLSNSQRKDG